MQNDLEKYFQKSDLIPAVIQEHGTGQVLMLAYMNRESLKKTLETGYTWFWSRSRQELWNKGATSGHLQKIVSIYGDCDDDTLLIEVIQTGAACHTAVTAVFLKRLKFRSGKIIKTFFIQVIKMDYIKNEYQVIIDRKMKKQKAPIPPILLSRG